MTNKDNEMILVFEKKVFEEIGLIEDMLATDVLSPLSEEDYEAMLEVINHSWDVGGSVKRRGDMEQDMSYLQPIPYTIIKQGSKYFAYTRLEGGGEARLHGKTSIGAGGHMDPIENAWNFEHLLAVNNARELEEELFILDENGKEIDNHYELSKESTIVGLGYTDISSVDAVHIAIYNIITIPEEWDVKVKETDILKGEFKTLEQIKEMNLENWSKMALSILK